MPYSVTTLGEIADNSESPVAAALSSYLDEMERDGWDFLTVVPNSRTWNSDGDFDGWVDSMLIFRQKATGSA